MQVSTVTAGYPDPATLGKRTEPTELPRGRAPGAGETQPATSSGAKAAMAQILARYDVARISPSEFSEMIQKLHQAGAITDGEFQELSAVRVDLEAAGIRPDEPVNLPDFYARKLKQLQQRAAEADDAAARSQLPPVLRRLDWVQKFALVQASPQSFGLDAAA